MMAKAAGPRAFGACSLPAVPPPAPACMPACLPIVGPSAAALSSWNTASAGASLGPDPPGTPSAGSAGDLPETFSVCSMDDASVNGSLASSLRGSLDAGPGDACPQGGALPRPSSFTSLPAAPLAAGGPGPAAWPALAPGCVWGTPTNGNVPPPMPGASPAAPVPPPAPVVWSPSPMLLPVSWVGGSRAGLQCSGSRRLACLL